MTQVWNTPLTPLAFLRALRGGLPGQDGDRLRRPPDQLPAVRRRGHPGRARAARLGHRAAATGSPTCCPTSPRCWSRTSRCRSPARCSSRSTPGCPPRRSRYILDHSGAKLLVVDAALYPTVGSGGRRAEDRRGDHHGDRPGQPGRRHRLRRHLRRPARPRPRRRPPWRSTTRERHDLDQLHVRDDGAAQGRDVPPPRRAPELVRRDRALVPHPTASTCGRCRCSTATAGAPRGRSRRSAARTSACARCAAT